MCVCVLITACVVQLSKTSDTSTDSRMRVQAPYDVRRTGY